MLIFCHLQGGDGEAAAQKVLSCADRDKLITMINMFSLQTGNISHTLFTSAEELDSLILKLNCIAAAAESLKKSLASPEKEDIMEPDDEGEEENDVEDDFDLNHKPVSKRRTLIPGLIFKSACRVPPGIQFL